MKQKTGRKLLSFLLTLAMLVGLMPGMGLTAYAAGGGTEVTQANVICQQYSYMDAGYYSGGTFYDTPPADITNIALADAQAFGAAVNCPTTYWVVVYAKDGDNLKWTSNGKTGEQTSTPRSASGRVLSAWCQLYNDDVCHFGGNYDPMRDVTFYFSKGLATVSVTGVSLDKTTAQTIDVDGKVSFTATVAPDNATDKKVKWNVGGTDTGAVKLYSDEACTTEVGADATDKLTVYAKGISAGSATITVTSNADSEKKASCDVTVNAAQTQTETLLTTITAVGASNATTATSANVSYSVEGVATLTFSGLVSYQASPAWGWWGYGWTATVAPANGYTITKCIFYDDANRTATDSSSPFVVETTEEDKTPRVNGNPILANTSKGITMIKVYGYATPASSYSVTITPGDHMTKTADSGDAEQTGLTGAMADVVYTADDGYYFPTDYSVAEVSGIEVTRDSYTQITVSGTPTADAAITLTAPTAKTTPDAPTAAATDCTTADNNDGTLTGVTTAMEYKKSDAADWTAGTDSDITGLAPGTYYVRVKATETTLASDNQELTIKGFISYTVTFKVVNGKWNEGEGDAATADKTVTLTGHDGDTFKLTADQIPTVGTKPNDTYKAGSWDTTPSADTEITADTTYTYTYAQKTAISQTVTFKVVNGKWDDETTEDKTVTLTGYEGDTLKLTAARIPAVGTKPSDTYKAGSWDVTPSADTEITGATTYTYTYAQKDSISQTVTFKVVNGKWDDDSTEDKTVTLSGLEGDTLKLTADQIPTVGTKPNDTYKAGSWDTTPSADTEITADTTYTYTYAQKTAISQTVTFKVVNGKWDDETTEDKTVTLTGYEGDTLKLTAARIPAVGTKPNDTYKAGSWDVTPSADTEITADTTYIYTYAQKDTISQTVTFKVVNGKWDDETTEDKTVTLTGYEGDALKLAANQIPAVGTKPNDTYKAGSWDTTPSAETEITGATTYTYTYAQKDGISQTVTFKVVNGKWDDETTTDKTVTLTGYEGDTLKLAANQIPAVGTKPNDTYKAGSWDVTPSADTAITAATTYTYTYVAKDSVSQTVTFKVVNGKWDDDSTADKTVTLTGYEGDTLKLTTDQIPTVGTKPNDTYKAGSWDVTPSADTAITEATTYTYTYVAKEASVVTKAPEAKTLTYNGQAQELVTAGTASGGTMQYAIGTKDAATQPYTTSIPAKTDAGTYYVWYKAVSDEDHSDSKPACITVTISKPAVAPAPADEEKGEANFKPSAAAPDVKGVEQEAIKTQMEELAKADDTKLKAGQVKEVTVNMETKAVAESDVPKKEASAIKETAEGMIPAKDRESTKCDFLDIAVSKIVIVYDVKNGQKVKNESDSISAGLTNLAQVIDIPVKYDLTGKFNPLIVRYHNGKAEAFRRLYAAPAKDALKDGTYYVEGTGKNAIVHIYTNRFSTYALLTSGTEEYPKLGDSVTVYRLYYGPTMEHFYTTSAYERRVLIDKYGWVDEGIAWKSPKAPTTDEEKKTIKPVYRLFNPFTTDHHYTKDANERKTLIEKYGWKDEGVAFYSNEKGDATVYRLWHPGLITGAHHFTTGKHEYDVLITRGWIGETEAFKVNAAS